MRSRVGSVRIQVAAVTLAFASVLSVGSISHAAPTTTDSTTNTDSTTTTTTDSTTTSTTTTTVDPYGQPADGGPLMTGSRPGTTIQTRPLPPPPTTTTTTTMPPPPTIPEWVLPADSGTGRRVVYSKSRQRVWAIDSNGTVVKTHKVSGRLLWCDPRVGTYSVFSRSRYTNSIQNPAIKWGYMVRFTKGCNGDNIGFHEIPKKNGVAVQSISQLGQPLSSGCVRQSVDDAIWMWNWAWIGTKVVVLP